MLPGISMLGPLEKVYLNMRKHKEQTGINWDARYVANILPMTNILERGLCASSSRI